jgi:serine/threonine protein kinase
MTPERWRQIEDLYHAARERGAGVLSDVDPELRSQVESLLAQRSGDEFLNQPAAEFLGESTLTQPVAGATLGPYRIEGLLGAGGMGKVYRAFDTRLNRSVAIKALPHDKADDPERKRRFMQEARVASALNHPNIVTLHDLLTASGVEYLVMEYVPGKSLDKLIARKGVPLAEAIGYAIQIASALAAAHIAGIVHRDIKSANAIVTAEGNVKVLDFGLAKLVGRAPAGDSEMQEPALTDSGTVMGTVPYMSPEQASGKPLDHRTDIFSLGVILYEMLAGERPFHGRSPVETMHAIVHDPAPPLEKQSPELGEILAKALAKDPKDRYQHAGDLELDLRRFKTAWLAKSLPSMGAAGAPRSLRSSAFALTAAVIALSLAAGWWIGHRARSEFSLGAEASILNLAGYSGTERSGAISPDGKVFAFISNQKGQSDICVRQVSGGDPVQITHDPAAKLDLIYAPDGESIYYSTGPATRIIWRVGVLGGTPRKIVENARFPAPSPDGKRLAYVSSGEALVVANADGTGPHQIGSALGAQYLQWSPDGHWLAYTAGSLFDTYQINIVDPDGKNKKQVTSFAAGTITCAAWLPDSRNIVFSNNPRPNPDSADLVFVSINSGDIRRLTLLPAGSFTSCSPGEISC